MVPLYYGVYLHGFKDTLRENTTSNKSQALAKSFNMDIWVIGALNQIFIRNSYTQIFFSENTVVIGISTFFVIDPICTLLLFVLKLTFDRAILYGNRTLSIVILSTTIWSAKFLKKVSFFRKFVSKLKNWKCSKSLVMPHKDMPIS